MLLTSFFVKLLHYVATRNHLKKRGEAEKPNE